MFFKQKKGGKLKRDECDFKRQKSVSLFKRFEIEEFLKSFFLFVTINHTFLY